MKKFFSTQSFKALQKLKSQETLYAFDFDGTLAKIEKNPNDSHISNTTTELLKKLSQRATIAIVSGRSISDLKKRLDFLPPYLIGNHGIEGLPSQSQHLIQSKKICSQWKLSLKTYLPNEYLKSGVEIEDKTYSLSIHYRNFAKRQIAKRLILNTISTFVPQPKIIPGKCVINLLPKNSPNKGIALKDLINSIGVKSVFYIGDDETDEAVFSLSNKSMLTVRVGKKINSRAQYFIQKQSEINPLLIKIINLY